MSVKYPEIKVKLTGRDGNAFAILGEVRSAMRLGGKSKEDINAFIEEATSGSYDHLLQTVMRTVKVT